ncbi:BatD family protein [Halarcobacter ebronensis]|uniref:BatD protein n=1 Tax=Halarcobacter ebronensis TaxID=1462615 RepID=A0A4Q1AT11_9BACT|nr:BatD family protein [Halarcobacter ebronensis]QKF82886.1 putative aerotolerance protein BatD [Halarcobacter ebronensis]RXK06903.1 hypothetical protein CRV07_05605 [Halarcobacter ebronensis]
MNCLRVLILFFLFLSSLYAEVLLKAPDSFVKGEAYFFELEVSGESLKFPKIEKIDDFVVQEQGTSKSMQYINGNYSEKYIKRYMIVPDKSFTIPSFKFIIDDKEVYTKSKSISEKRVDKTDSTDFDLTLIPSKTSLYVGEELNIKLVFKYKKDLQITNLGFDKPHFENFWYKKLDNSNKRYEDNGFIVQELEFLLFPQKSGELSVGPLRVDVQMVNRANNTPFSFFTSLPVEKKIYSNRLNFSVKSLPSNISLIGDFNIDATVDKQKIKEGESISLKLNIDGVGNFDDIQDIKLNIPNATIYDNKPEIKTNYTNRGYEGTYTKVFSIVPSESLVIPSIKIEYFDKKEKKIITKQSKSFKIEVEKSKEQKAVLEKSKEQTTKSLKESVVIEELSIRQRVEYFIFGIITTLFIFGLYTLVKIQNSKKESKDAPLVSLIKRAKTKNEMIKVLIPFLKKDEKLDKLIFECESQKDFKILKKEILERIKEIKI